MLPRGPPGIPRNMGTGWKVSTPDEIKSHYHSGPQAWDRLSTEQQKAYIADIQKIEEKNKKEHDDMAKRNYGVNTPVQTVEESGFKTVAQKLNDEKKKRDEQTLKRAVKMKLKKLGMDPNNTKLIQQGLEQLQTSRCTLTGTNDDDTANTCAEQLMFSQNGARRRNRTKHRRSRHKRTRRYRKN